jgi:thioredoxin reductase (NADPH)
MSDEPRRSMFDYDARPVTPQIVLVGRRASSLGYELRDFLSRNGVPYDWVEIDEQDRVRQLLDGDDVDPSRLPICVLPDGRRIAEATVEQVEIGRAHV